MSTPRHDLGLARVVKADAVGTPGKRVFRLTAEAERGSAVVTVEKEQLSALALGIQRLMEEIKEVPMGAYRSATEVSPEPSFEFRAYSLGLAYDQGDHTFAILAYDEEDARRDVPTVSCSFSRKQAASFADDALELASAGRPSCFLCKQPMDPEGHVCPMSNGHKSVADEL